MESVFQASHLRYCTSTSRSGTRCIVWKLAQGLWGCQRHGQEPFPIWTKKSSIQYNPPCTFGEREKTLQQVFDHIFHAQLHPTLTADMFFSAPKSFVQQWISASAIIRGFPPIDPGGRAWKYGHVLPAGLRWRLRRHEALAVESGYEVGSTLFMDLNQTPEFMAPRLCLPTLMRGTKTWSFKERRLLLPHEAAESMLMGPIFLRTDYEACESDACQVEHAPVLDQIDLDCRLRLFNSIRDSQPTLPRGAAGTLRSGRSRRSTSTQRCKSGSSSFTEKELRDMSGNGISIEVFGAVLFSVFSSTSRIQDATSTLAFVY